MNRILDTDPKSRNCPNFQFSRPNSDCRFPKAPESRKSFIRLGIFSQSGLGRNFRLGARLRTLVYTRHVTGKLLCWLLTMSRFFSFFLSINHLCIAFLWFSCWYTHTYRCGILSTVSVDLAKSAHLQKIFSRSPLILILC